MDNLAFHSYLRAQSAARAAPPVVAQQKQTPAPAAVATKVASERPKNPGAFEKGDPRLGKPPWTKDRFPAAFIGGKTGMKKKAPKKRELLAALSASVATANPHREGNFMDPEYLTSHISKKDVTRISRLVGMGEMSVSEGAGRMAALSSGYFNAPGVSSYVTAAAQGGPVSSEIIARNAPSTGPAPQPSVSSAPDLTQELPGGVGAGGESYDILTGEAPLRRRIPGEIQRPTPLLEPASGKPKLPIKPKTMRSERRSAASVNAGKIATSIIDSAIAARSRHATSSFADELDLPLLSEVGT